MGTDDPVALGRKVKEKDTTSGLVVLVVLKENRAVEVFRKLVGPTSPHAAPPGTIRGDYSVDSPDYEAEEGRVIYNFVHASAPLRLKER